MGSDPKRIVISGATSGIGRELAEQYAAAGVHLGITGRREQLLEEIAATCREKGAKVETYTQDVSDGAGMQELARAFIEAAGGVDLVIANAGMGNPDRLSSGDPTPINRLLEVNIQGVVSTLVPFVPKMKEQGSGHLVAIASVAGARALPGHAAYSASKLAVRTLMEGFGWELQRYGISATCVNPGFVVSEMTDKNDFPMPFIVPTEKAVRGIRKALRKKKRVYTFPLPMRIASWVLGWAPGWIIKRLPR